MSIKKIYSKQLIYFQYASDFNNVCERLNQSHSLKAFDNVVSRDIKLSEYIKDRLNDSNFLSSYSLNYNYNKFYVDPSKRRNISLSFNASDKLELNHFNIDNVRIHIFNTGIGFLELNYSFFMPGLESIINTIYKLKMLKGDSLKKVIFRKKIGKDDYLYDDINIYDFIRDLLKMIGNISISNVNTEALTYNLVLLEKNKNDISLQKLAFKLSRGYKDSYKIKQDDVTLSVYNEFDNITWGFSLEGATCVARLCDDVITNDFIENNLFSLNGNLQTVYFMMYLLILNQRYSLFSIQNKLDRFIREKDSFNNEMLLTFKKIKNEIILFNSSAILFDVGENTLYSKYYDKLFKTNRIHQLIEEYKIKANSIEQQLDIFKIEVEQQKTKVENKKNKTINKIGKIGVIVALIAFLPNFESVMQKLLNEFSISYEDIPLMTILLGIGIFGITIYEIVIYYIKKRG